MSDETILSFANAIKQREMIAAGNVGQSLVPPDKAARANVLARDFNVPPDFAERNLDALDRQSRQTGVADMIQRYPGVAEWFGNPRNAAIATDDIGSLSTVAKALKRRVPGQAVIENEVPPVANFRNFFKGVWTNLVESGKASKAGFSAIAADAMPAPAPRQGVPQLGDFGFENAMERYGRAQGAIAAARPDFGSGWQAKTLSGLYSGTASAAQMVPAIGIGALTGGAGGALALSAPVGLEAYGKYRSRGASPGMAGLGAAGEAGAEFVTEVLPMSFIVNKLGKLGFGSFTRGLLGREIPGEQLATITQDAIDTAIANPDKTWGEYLAERPDAAYETFVATLVPGALAGGSSEVARKLHLREQVKQAETDANFLTELATGVTESKTAKRDPSAFAAFLAMQADGSPVENLYVPADKLTEFFQSNDMDYRGEDSPFAFDPGFADQYEEAAASGGDVVIPTAQFAAHLAGSPAWESLKDHVRLSPGGVSLAEARTFAEASDAAMEMMGEEYAAQVEAERAAMEPRQKLYQSIRDKLTNAGFTQSAADTNAALVTARYATRAARQGKEIDGTEFDAVGVNQILPEKLAPIVAADQLDLVYDAMKRDRAQRSDKQKFGPSLLEWIASQGGIEDKGGDLASMGLDQWHKGKPGRRKLIRPHNGDPSFLPSTQENANTPDELALRAQEAGYFPVGERPDINALNEAIDAELRGKPVYAEDRSGTTDQMREAADQLAALLDQEGLDPTTASKADVRKAVERYQAEQMAGRGFDQSSDAFKRWSKGAQVLSPAAASTHEFKTGEAFVGEAFHGTSRPDRIGDQFRADRATAGPMAYFTSDPTLASSYSTNKSDTSIDEEDQNYSNWFKVTVGGKTYPLEKTWAILPTEVRAKIRAMAPRIQLDDETGEQIILGDESNTRGNGGYDHALIESRGNPLKALVESWLTSGALFDDEQRFMEVLKLAGMPMDQVAFDDPHATYSSVIPVWIAMQNPLVTSEVPTEVDAALNAAAQAEPEREGSVYDSASNIWDKAGWSVREWVEQFNSPDDRQWVWTRIPDGVTEVFKRLGYDGIVDWSGKGGGTEVHPVYIPFEATQIKSKFNRGTFDGSDPRILFQPATTKGLRSDVAIAFTRDLDAIKAGTAARGMVLKLGYPSEALRAAGLPALPILYKQSEASKTLTGKHEGLIDEETLRRLPEAVADPALVFTQSNGRFAVIIEDASGAPVLASIEPRGVVGTTRGNLVVTVHPKGSDAAIVKAIADGRVTYRDEGRSQQWFDQAQRQLPGREPTADKGDVAQSTEKSKPTRPILSIKTKRSLEQSYMDGPRGRISFQEGGKSVIDLFQARDSSTFLHESAHLWLEELRFDAEQPDATDQIKGDWQAVQDWFATNGQTVAGDIPVEAHEMWARGVERFLMEGKAPSTGLRKVFDTFRSWLLNIYQVVANLRSPITPEIRDVMARLIATDAEIDEARQEQNIKALFTDAASAGMTEPVFAEYQKLTQEARDEAFDALLFRTMSTIRQQRTKAWKEERDAVRAEVTERVNARPEFRALALMRAKGSGLRLDRAWLVETYGEDALSLLPKGVPPIYGENGTAADAIAEMAGFATGDDLVRTLLAVGARKAEMVEAGDKRSVRESLIEDETAAVMAERHGDPLSDGSIEEEALALIHNDKRGEVIASELRALSAKSNRRPTPYALARQWAAETIAQSKVADSLSGSALQRYARAARNAAKLAEEAMLKGDVDATYRQKQRQMLNNALIAEATKAKALVDAAVTRLSKVAKRATIKGVSQDYTDQAHALLEQVDFRRRPQSQIDRQESFEAWAEARRAEGHDVVVPGSFAATLGKDNWSRLSVEKLLGLKDAVDQIIHLGRFKQTLIDNKEARDFEELVAEAEDSAGGLRQRPPATLAQPGFFDAIRAGVESWDTALLKVETIIDWLDGGKADGVFNRIVFRPIAEAQDRESDMLKDYQAKVVEAMKALPDKTLRRWQEKVNINLGGPFGGPTQRQQLVAMALNMGNEGNIQRLTDGYGWSEQAVWDVLERELKAEDWVFVQEVWDIIDGLWPQIEAMEKRINGVAPEKVEAVPRLIGDVALRGGYYPAIYDTNLSIDAEVNAGKESDLFDTIYTRANTTASATKARAQKVKRPILLQLGVINRHLGEVIHDLTHREAVMQADKFLSNRRVIAAIDGSLGPEYRRMFRPWLKFIANQWAMERSGNEGIGAFLSKARTNTTVVGMGFRITTILTQIAGYSNSFEYVGAKWVTAAIARTAAHPIESFNFVMERSGEVRNRMDTIDRDIREGIGRLAGKAGFVSEARRFAFHGIGLADRMVVIPTWIGAYNKAIASGATEDAAIYEGDKAVRKSQGAAAAKDMAAVQRGTGKYGELLKLMTMFYSYMSAQYQRQRTLGRDVRDARSGDIPEIVSRVLWLVIVPPLLAAGLSGDWPDEDEDWATWAFKRILFNGLGPIPIARDLARPIWDKVAGNPSFGYALSPVQRAGQVLIEAVDDVSDVIAGEETRKATRNIMEAVGYSTGLIPGQIAASTQFIVDVAYGEQEPDSVADWIEGLAKGRIKDD